MSERTLRRSGILPLLRLRRPAGLAGLAAAAALAVPAGLPGPARADLPPIFPVSGWSSAAPHDLGLDAQRLDELAALVGGSGMVIRDGWVALEWGDGGTARGDWASASKPVLTTLLFLADDRGLAGLHTPMADLLDGGSAKDDAITFFQLANMTSGYSRTEGSGTAWAYNDPAVNLYGYALCERVFGAPPSAVFAAELAFLAFEDSPVVSDGQYGRLVSMSIRDFARFGLLWMNRGSWAGAAVVPASYFDLVTNQVDPDLPRTTADGPESWDLGTFGGTDDQQSLGPGHYGMNFWVNTNGLWPDAPADAFAAVGHGGRETCVVLPGLGIVAAGLGGWGVSPDDATFREAMRLLVESVGPVPVEPATWGSIRAPYRGE